MIDVFYYLLLGVFLWLLFFRPILLVYIPLAIVFFVFKCFIYLFKWLRVQFVYFIIRRIIDINVNKFEKSIQNKGIRKDVDVALCHTFFNSIDTETMLLLFNIYLAKTKYCLRDESYNEEQAERYLHLLEIMYRSLMFKFNN